DTGPLHSGGAEADSGGVPRSRRAARRAAARLRGNRRDHGPADGNGEEPDQPRPYEASGALERHIQHAGGITASPDHRTYGAGSSPAAGPFFVRELPHKQVFRIGSDGYSQRGACLCVTVTNLRERRIILGWTMSSSASM